MSTLTIQLNGAAHAIAHGQTVAQLIAELGLQHRKLAVAINREVVARERWPRHAVQANDRIEIVHAIGGG